MSSGLAAPPRSSDAPARGAGKGAYRRDIQGLRALGLMVMFLCHAELSVGSGGFVGLDVFFVISGFLITGLLLAELRRGGTLSLAGFYARRVRRLLPLAITVLATVVAVSWVLLSPVQNDRVAADVVAASVYAVNWHFVAQEVDYFAVDPDDSPIQHFWSLSVEEQFYLVWPLLLLIAFASLAGRGRRPVKPLLGITVALVGVPSLVYSVAIVDLTGDGAYFSTLARVWEFALGGALALALPARLRLPRWTVALLGWSGLVAILATTAIFTSETAYPGTAALIPTLGTVAIVIAGTATVSTLPIRVLSCPPAQYLGDVSYAWYLWHWPALVFARALWGPLTPVEALLVIGAAWVPTEISHRLIEKPLRHAPALASRSRRALAFGAACMATAVVLASLLTALQPSVPVASSNEVEGAAVVDAGKPLQRRAVALRPTPRRADEDRGMLYEDGCLVQQDETESPACVYAHAESSTGVVLLGDSHAMHWFPALLPVARDRGWRLVALTRAGCPVADVRFAPRCDAWRRRALRRIERRERPALVIVATTTSGRLGVVEDGERLSREASEAPYEAGYVRTLRRLRSSGAKVVVIEDPPRSPEHVPSCVSRSLDRLERCAFRAPRKRGNGFDARAAARVGGVRLLDPRPMLCPDGLCPAVMGNALVYRDTNHLTRTFARTLAPWLARSLPKSPR